MKSRAKAPEKQPVTPTASAGSDDAVTEGQRSLRAVTASNAEIAKRVGVSKTLVTYWRTGAKLPAPEMRRVLETLYRIPATAWDQRTGSSTPGPGPVTTEVRREAATTNRSGVEEMLVAILQERSVGKLAVQEFTRLIDAEARVRKLIHELDQAEALTETRIVASPTMRRIRDRIFAALERHPNALRDVLDALGVPT